MKMNETSCCKEKCKGVKWLVAISAMVGFVGMASVFAMWLFKRYKKCVAPYTDAGSLDCSPTLFEY